jgi:hypothetical protein
VDAGIGFDFDFNYFLVRIGMAVRFKKPDVAENNGWHFPNINLKNLFLADGKQWRYENANISIGINYPF